jgi:hypothetical protein
MGAGGIWGLVLGDVRFHTVYVAWIFDKWFSVPEGLYLARCRSFSEAILGICFGRCCAKCPLRRGPLFMAATRGNALGDIQGHEKRSFYRMWCQNGCDLWKL